jgi:hypothetical protein
MAGIGDEDAIKRGRSQCGRWRLLSSRHDPQDCDLNAKHSHSCVPTRQANPANPVCKQQPLGKCPNTSTKVHFAFPFFVLGATLSVISNSHKAFRRFRSVNCFFNRLQLHIPRFGISPEIQREVGAPESRPPLHRQVKIRSRRG